MARREAELDAVVGEYRVDLVGHGRDQGDQEGRCRHAACLHDQLHEGEFGRAVDRDEEVKLALCGLNLCDVDVEVADRVALELPPVRLVALHLGQSADPMPLETAVQR